MAKRRQMKKRKNKNFTRGASKTTTPAHSKAAPAKMEPLVPKIEGYQTFRVVGLGGVGSILLGLLSTFLRSLNKPVHVNLIDGDDYEPNNMARMQFSSYGNKAEVKAEEIKGDNPHMAVTTVTEYITEENIEEIIREDDIIFCCVDNHSTRKLLNDRCAKLKNVVLISGGNDGVELEKNMLGTCGNVQVYVRRNGKDVTVPITKFHPEIENPKDKNPAELSCQELAMSVPQILFANANVALGMLNTLYALSCGRLKYQEMCFDILSGRQLPQHNLSEPVSM